MITTITIVERMGKVEELHNILLTQEGLGYSIFLYMEVDEVLFCRARLVKGKAIMANTTKKAKM